MNTYTQDHEQNISPEEALSPSEREAQGLTPSAPQDYYCRTCAKTFRFAALDITGERDGCPHCCSCNYTAVRAGTAEIEYFEDMEDTDTADDSCLDCGGLTDRQDTEARQMGVSCVCGKGEG